MLVDDDAVAVVAIDEEVQVKGRGRVVAAPTGIVAARLADALGQGDVLFVASDEQRAELVTAALRAMMPDAQVVHCPSSDALPGDDAPASAANVGRRVAAFRLLQLRNASALAFITTAEAAARLYATPAGFSTAPPRLAVGDPIDLAAVEQHYRDIGYIVDDRVDEPGEVAVRGQVIDIYPADAPNPARVEVADGHIVAIRNYDPVTQRTDTGIAELEIGRVAEPPVGADGVTIFDHLPAAAVALDVDATARRDRFVALARDAAAQRNRSVRGIVDAELWARAIDGRTMIGVARGHEQDVPRFVERSAPLKAFARTAKEAIGAGSNVLIAGGNRDLRFLRARVAKAIGQEAVDVADWRDVRFARAGSLLMLAAPLTRGWREPGLLVVAAADLLGSRAEQDAADSASADTMPAGSEIRAGDVIVHEDFGIGVVAGLDLLPRIGDAEPGDAIVLEYADGGRRLVPTAEADRIWRYGADADAVKRDKLDGTSWAKRRGAIDAAIATSARELTALAAERAARTTDALVPDPAAYERFAAGFAFTETTDQARAIASVRTDLASGKPMDRLVVGDVGYGKTEVALRAAALVALAGRQVAIAAPTTVLVRQHLETFRRRFAGTGIEVAALSRLSSAAEKKAVKAGLADGSIGVVVGTGAIAAKGVAYRDLKLVVIDEEQRFGTADKAKLRGLTDGHMLTLTATPIPRTLQTALVGLQQLSIIATPPARRQPIRTSIGTFDPATVRTALMREKGRGGQSFIVVPRIEDMAAMATQLAALVPELGIVQAHGKMPPADIDEAMIGFANGISDVLLATNIIEAGLDVPRANTMIVARADRFGLSQLHQLRGRVGRSSRRGQVLLLTEPDAKIADATVRRLRALQAFDRLGAGFAISARDLDMRGAGDLLGDEQTGHMKLIGVELYQYLLESALKAARGETVERWTPELNLGIAGCLPESWIADADVRIALYCRLARFDDAQALALFEDELADRFGALPPPATRLMTLARLAMLARAARIARVDAGPAAIALRPRPDFRAAIPEGVVEKDGRLLARDRIEDPERRVARAEALLAEMAHQDED